MADNDALINALLEKARPQQQAWGGLKSYAPDQPEWMRTVQQSVGRGLASIPEPAMFALNFLGRTPARVSADAVPPQFRGRAPESPLQPGTRDDTGAWFLEGDKPIYGNGSRASLDGLFGPEYAKRFDAFRSIAINDADGNVHGYWLKPSLTPEQAQAFNELARAQKKFSPTKASDEEWTQMHRLHGSAFGYPPEAIEAWINHSSRKP